MIKTLQLSNNLFQYKLDGMKMGINCGCQVSEIIARHLSDRPFHLNVIEAACHGRFKETGHSLVLADMLRHPAIQNSFMEKHLGLSHDYMEVTAETDRVDVALKGDDIFVIVENKVNAAEEQNCQVYRYVHEIAIDKYGYELSQIYVLYLNPTNNNLPSEYSLCDENNENNVFEELGEGHYKVLSYKYDVTAWLRRISDDNELHINNEPHIVSALDQYIDFLENKFHTTKLDIDMNNEIKDFLLKELNVDNSTLEEQLSALDSQCNKTKELLDSIDSLKIELRKELSHKTMREWQRQIEELLCIKLSQDDHSFWVQLNNKVWLGVWDGYDDPEYNYLPYWGFKYTTYKKDENPELYKCIETLITEAGINNDFIEGQKFIAWYPTQKGVETFTSLYHAAKEKGLLP